MEDEPSTSKFQASSLFNYDSPEEAKQEITDALHYCLHFMQKGKYTMDQVSNSTSSS
jgi:hypothetical protein